ncbi:MAG: Matrixin [Phycisphaerales bacterium]|nr:Matrixin [Phycisphaerales bacterium]
MPKSLPIRCWLLLCALGGLCALCASPAPADERSPDVTEPPAYDQFIIVPLRIHILSADDLPDIDCKLTDADVVRIIGKANGIWHQAGVHLGLESIVHEAAAHKDEFRMALEKSGPDALELYKLLRPQASRDFAGMHVYYIHRFAVNGVFVGDGTAFVQETASLRTVEGGIDEPIPRVTAHELGHAMGLSHRQNRTNLMASGTTGTLLNATEVERVREHVRHAPGAMSASEAHEAATNATKKGDAATATRTWGWLSEIPGDGAEEAKGHLAGPPAPANRPVGKAPYSNCPPLARHSSPPP